MKRVLLFAAACACAVAGLWAAAHLPADTAPLIEEKYDTWSGVLRVWAAEDTGMPGLTGWLNACAAKVEKARNGVYISIRTVPGEAIAGFLTTGVNPPDVIIYPSGLIVPDAGLEVIAAAYPLRRGLSSSPYAVPVLADAHFWIYNTGSYSTLPADMYQVSAACREEDLNALTALSTGLRPAEGVSRALPGVDLGLGGAAEATPAPAGEVACRMGPHLTLTDEPRKLFLNGGADAFVGSVSDILYLADKSGWEAAVTGEYAYTDNLLMCSIVAKDDGRSEICRAFLDALMSVGQASAARAGALPTVAGVSAWAGDMAMARLEAALESRTWVAGAAGASDAARSYIEGTLSADQAMDEIMN